MSDRVQLLARLQDLSAFGTRYKLEHTGQIKRGPQNIMIRIALRTTMALAAPQSGRTTPSQTKGAFRQIEKPASE
jgi:hypothetical protein